MLKKRIVAVCVSAIICGIMLLPAVVLGQNNPTESQDRLGLQYGEASGLSSTDVRVTIARMISISLGLIGTIMVVLMIYAGFLWMTARGEESQIEKAQKTIFSAIVGLAITLTAWAITRFVLSSLLESTTGFRSQL